MEASIIELIGSYMSKDSERETFKIHINRSDWEKGKIYESFVKNNILCFNSNLLAKAINYYLKILISQKLKSLTIPHSCGFESDNKEKWIFVSKEYYEWKNIPVMSQRSFNLSSNTTYDIVIKNFVQLLKSSSDPTLFLFLNIIRLTGLLFTPLCSASMIFNKILLIKGDPNKICPYLQVYDRDTTTQRAESLNVKPKVFHEYLNDHKDEVIMLSSNENDTKYKQTNGTEILNIINDMLHDNVNNDLQKYPYIFAVISRNSFISINHDDYMIVDARSFTSDLESKHIRIALQEFDKLIIEKVCSSKNNFIDYITKSIKQHDSEIEISQYNF